MKVILNNILKGLLVALLVISLGGFLYINISKPEEINLQLISSSVVNQLGTESKNVKETKKENNDNKKVVENKEEKKEDKKEDTTKNEEVKEETSEEVKKEEIQEKVEKDSNEQELTIDEKVPETKTEEKKEEVVETKPDVVETPKEEVPKTNQNTKPKETTTGPYAPNMAAVNALSVLETHVGKITAYGPDCYGCYGSLVAHGEYVGDGRIYYNDPTYGTIRIVAGDERLGLGAIVRIKGVAAEPIIAIMLDTGGDIGFNKRKKIFFDLLFESEKAAGEKFGSYDNATFEILKYGS